MHRSPKLEIRVAIHAANNTAAAVRNALMVAPAECAINDDPCATQAAGKHVKQKTLSRECLQASDPRGGQSRIPCSLIFMSTAHDTRSHGGGCERNKVGQRIDESPRKRGQGTCGMRYVARVVRGRTMSVVLVADGRPSKCDRLEPGPQMRADGSDSDVLPFSRRRCWPRSLFFGGRDQITKLGRNLIRGGHRHSGCEAELGCVKSGGRSESLARHRRSWLGY